MKFKYILLLCCAVTQVWAVGEAGAIFLLIAPGAGPVGTGEAQVAKADDAYASYYNPAGLGFLKGKEAVGMHVNWLPNLASDLFYEFLAYRHYIDGLGSVGGHIIYLNLGEQIGMDEFGNPTDNWKSYMGAIAGSFGTQLSETSAIGFNFKVFHQKLSDQVVAGEEGKGYSTDFGFDIGYLKKFKKSAKKIVEVRTKKTEKIFDQLPIIYNSQRELNEKIEFELDKNENILLLLEEQELILSDVDKLSASTKFMENIPSYYLFYDGLDRVKEDIVELINFLDEINNFERIESISDTLVDNSIYTMDKILLDFLEVEKMDSDILNEIKLSDAESDAEVQDKFNFGFSISNIGPKIDFVDVDQADPSPTNMRLGIFTQLYNDGYNKVNFLFDASKLLVTRYQMMDWDGDGFVGGYDEYGNSYFANENPVGEYNKDGKKEYDSKGYMDDPWYLAIATAWLDDWYFGGDIDHDGDRQIGGWSWSGETDDDNGDGEPNIEELKENDNGVYGKCVNDEVCLEKGTGESRSFTKELEEMVYNMGMEYWYTDAFALRAGYIYDFEGKIFNPTFGAGIRLLQYGFDFGYTAGETGHPRANTMFFSVNIKL